MTTRRTRRRAPEKSIFRTNVDRIISDIGWWFTPKVRNYYKDFFRPTPHELEQDRARSVSPADWVHLLDEDLVPVYFIPYDRPPEGYIRVMWYPSSSSLNMESHLQDIFPLEEDGSFDFTQVMKAWNLVNCVPLDCRRGRRFHTADPNMATRLVLHNLLDANDVLRIIEEPPEELAAIREWRLYIVTEYRYIRWFLKNHSKSYMKERLQWWYSDPLNHSLITFWVFLEYFYFTLSFTWVPYIYMYWLYCLCCLPFSSNAPSSHNPTFSSTFSSMNRTDPTMTSVVASFVGGG